MISNAEPPRPEPTRGQMTAVMRAAPRPAADRVLRAALVRAGKVIDERILPPGAPLTVGPSEQATFVIATLPRTVKLIEREGDKHRIHRLAGASGRVASGGSVFDLEPARAAEPLIVGPDARGKIAVGDGIILFHFIDPPVPPPRAQLPLAVQKGVFDGLDWKTTFIAAFSFLFHFGAAGAVYSDWADGVIDDDVRVAQLTEIIKEMRPPPPVETAAPVTDDKATATAPKDAQSPKPTTAQGRSTGNAPSAGAGRGGPMGERKAHEIASQLASLDDVMVQAIGARGGNGVNRVLNASDVPIGMLDGIAASAGGNRPGDPSGLNLRGDGGGAVKPGGGGGPCGLVGCVNKKAGGELDDHGKSAEVRKPVGNASVSAPEVNGGRVSDAGRVVAGMRGLLRACYKKTLDVDPTARGTVRVTATIAPNGDVQSVQAANGGLPSDMVSCVSRVVRGAQFGAPEGGGATLVIPMSFYAQ